MTSKRRKRCYCTEQQLAIVAASAFAIKPIFPRTTICRLVWAHNRGRSDRCRALLISLSMVIARVKRAELTAGVLRSNSTRFVSLRICSGMEQVVQQNLQVLQQATSRHQVAQLVAACTTTSTLQYRNNGVRAYSSRWSLNSTSSVCRGCSTFNKSQAYNKLYNKFTTNCRV